MHLLCGSAAADAVSSGAPLFRDASVGSPNMVTKHGLPRQSHFFRVPTWLEGQETTDDCASFIRLKLSQKERLRRVLDVVSTSGGEIPRCAPRQNSR